MQVGELVTKFVADMTGLQNGVAQYGKELDKAEKDTRSFDDKLSDLSTTLSEVAAGFTIGAAAVITFIKAATGYADSMKSASYATGLSTEQLQRWREAGLEADVPFEQLTMAARMMTSRMGEVADGGSEMSKSLKAIGVSAYDANGDLKDTNTMMWDIINGLAKQPAGMERSSRALAILGRSWYYLAPMIEQATEAQEAYNKAEPFSGKKIDDLHDYQTALDKAGGAMERWTVIIGEKLSPLITPFTNLIDGMTLAIEEMAYQWDVAQYKAEKFVLWQMGLAGLDNGKYNALVTAGEPQRPAPRTPGSPVGGNTFKPDIKLQEESTKNAMESMTDAIKEQNRALKDLNDEKERLADLDKDYAREMSLVGWDVGKARELTIRHGWAEQDQKGKVSAAQANFGKASAKVAETMFTIAGNLTINIPGYTGSPTDANNLARMIAKEAKVGGITS